MTVEAPAVNGSAAATEYVPPKPIEQLTDTERTHWLKTGEVPPSREASATSEPASEEARKEAQSGSAKKPEQSDKDKNWRALEKARDDAKAEAETLRRELEEARKPKSAEAAPPEKKADAAKSPEAPKRPRMSEFLNDGTLDSEKYEAAMDKYEEDREKYRAFQDFKKNAEVEGKKLIDQWTSHIKEKYADKADGFDVTKTLDQIVAVHKDASAFTSFLNDSEVFPDLLYVLGTDPKLSELLEEAKTSPTKAIRRLIVIEAEIKKELAAGKAKGKTDDTKHDDNKDDEDEPEKKVTRAGKPPSEFNGGSSAPADEEEAALKRGDSEEFRRLRNAKDVAKFKVRRGR